MITSIPARLRCGTGAIGGAYCPPCATVGCCDQTSLPVGYCGCSYRGCSYCCGIGSVGMEARPPCSGTAHGSCGGTYPDGPCGGPPGGWYVDISPPGRAPRPVPHHVR